MLENEFQSELKLLFALFAVLALNYVFVAKLLANVSNYPKL